MQIIGHIAYRSSSIIFLVPTNGIDCNDSVVYWMNKSVA